MILQTIDWLIIAAFLILSLVIGVLVSKRAGDSTSDFFLSGRSMPWWLLGISMVATTFSADTPNLVTNLVRQNGVSGNWGWWAFLLTGMLTTFVYAKLWRRSKVMTDIEFYELRYSGKAAAFLRGFRALYLGLVFNTLVIGTVSLAAIKFGEIMLGLEGWQTLLIAGTVTLIYSTLGGLRAVIITDFIQFIMAMIGSVWAAVYILNLPEVGGLSNLLDNGEVLSKMSIWPDFSDPSHWIPILLVPLAVQWWASYYPGSEPGGGGYVAQRMFSAKSESHAMGATLFYNLAHYGLRPWPWILIALASLVLYPELSDLSAAFPGISSDKLGHDVAYPVMLTRLPVGLLGFVAASLMAAFMSTISTQLNLGASYLVNDFYKRFMVPEASEKKLVWAGRLFTILSMVIGAVLGLLLKDAAQAFNLLLLLGAGTGLIYILRWFWWRINAFTEIVAMASSLIIAGYFSLIHDELGFLPLLAWEKLVVGVALTTAVWIIAAYVTPATDRATLVQFYKLIRPAGRGWNDIRSSLESEETMRRKSSLGKELYAALLGCVLIYSGLFAVGFWLYGEYASLAVFATTAMVSLLLLTRLVRKIEFL